MLLRFESGPSSCASSNPLLRQSHFFLCSVSLNASNSPIFISSEFQNHICADLTFQMEYLIFISSLCPPSSSLSRMGVWIKVTSIQPTIQRKNLKVILDSVLFLPSQYSLLTSLAESTSTSNQSTFLLFTFLP